MTNRCIPAFFDVDFLEQEFKPFSHVLDRISGPSVKGDWGITIGETENAVFVDLPMPGCRKEKIQITFEKGSLLVCCDEDAELESEEKKIKYHAKSSRRYAYRVPIPARVDENSPPEAVYKNGILRAKFMKSRSSRPLKITVQGE